MSLKKIAPLLEYQSIPFTNEQIQKLHDINETEGALFLAKRDSLCRAAKASALLRGSSLIFETGFINLCPSSIVGVEQVEIQDITYQFIVKPKINNSDFLIMMNYAYNNIVEDPFNNNDAFIVNKEDDFQLIFIYWFLNGLQNFVRRYFAIDFISKEEFLNSKIKGKILVNDYLKHSYPKYRHQIIPCKFFEITEDILENQIIKYALKLVHTFTLTLENEESKNILHALTNKINPFFAGVTLKKIFPGDFKRIKYTGRFRNYRDIHELCKLIINSIQVDLDNADMKFKSFTLDMNKLFELFVCGILKSHFGEDGVEYQYSFNYKVGDRFNEIKPDFVLKTNNENIIIDAKYKSLFEKESDDIVLDENIRIKPTDIYQLISYSYHQELNSPVSFLVYPKEMKAKEITNFINSNQNKKYYLIGIGLDNNSKGKLRENIDKFFKELDEKIGSSIPPSS